MNEEKLSDIVVIRPGPYKAVPVPQAIADQGEAAISAYADAQCAEQDKERAAKTAPAPVPVA